jgi:hypothetical protein
MRNEKPIGTLTGPNLISCVEELALQDYDDLTHSTELATRSADRVISRTVDSAKWLDEYVSTLNFLGWSVFQDAIFTRTRHDLSRSVADFLVQSAQAMPDARQGNAMIDLLEALKPNKPAQLSLDQESLMGEHFRVIPARYDSKGFLTIAVFNLELISNTKKSNFLFFDWEEHPARIIQQGTYLKLDKNVFDTKRALIDSQRRKIRATRFRM